MKIIRLHVVGFGKLTDKIYTFDNLTSILSENGEGKSTLALFIEGMFYGLEAKNSELRAYKPWNGAPFGGSITFIANEKTYRAERFWGNRKSDDEFSLYTMPNKTPSLDYTEKLGEELFGIDRSAFKRTCFFTSEDYRGGETSIQSRLNSLIADTDEFNSFDKVTLNIEKEIKTFENAQHRGKIPDVKKELEELRTQIAVLLNSPLLYQQLSEEQEKLNNDINTVKREILNAEKQAEQKMLCTSDGSKALEVLNQRETELNLEKQKALSFLNGYKITHSTLDKLSEEKHRLDSLEMQTVQAVPSPTFSRPLPSKEELNQISVLNANLQEKTEQFNQRKDKRKKQKVCFLFLLILSFALTVIGAINFSRPYICIPFTVCGIIFLAISVIFLLKDKNQTNADAVYLQNEINTFLFNYGYGGYDINSALNLLSQEISTKQAEQEKQLKNQEYLLSLKQEREQIKRNIDGFFAKLNLYGDYQKNYYTVKSAIETVERADNELSVLQTKKTKYSVDEKSKNELALIKKNKTEAENRLALLSRQTQDNQIRILSLSDKITKLNSLTAQRAFLLEEQQKLEQEKFILEQTLSCLRKAKENLTDGAYEPIKASLKKYCGLLLPAFSGIKVDNNFKITCEINGVTRDFSSFSQGQKQLINFALRLGLIDALFEKEKPFVLIDDAFSPLDQQNFDLCKKLVEQISTEMQVVYLTPHPSRQL